MVVRPSAPPAAAAAAEAPSRLLLVILSQYNVGREEKTITVERRMNTLEMTCVCEAFLLRTGVAPPPGPYAPRPHAPPPRPGGLSLPPTIQKDGQTLYLRRNFDGEIMYKWPGSKDTCA